MRNGYTDESEWLRRLKRNGNAIHAEFAQCRKKGFYIPIYDNTQFILQSHVV